jgi:hypothetical protein
MKINVKKTKVMVVSREERRAVNLTIDATKSNRSRHLNILEWL